MLLILCHNFRKLNIFTVHILILRFDYLNFELIEFRQKVQNWKYS